MVPTAAGRAGLFLYWLSFASPRRSKNERNAVIGAICARVCAPNVFTAARYDHPIMPDLGTQSAETMLRGSVLVLLQFDVCEAIRLDLHYTLAYINRGVSYFHTQQYDKAIDDYTKAIRLNPDNADAYYNRGLTYGKKGEQIVKMMDDETWLTADMGISGGNFFVAETGSVVLVTWSAACPPMAATSCCVRPRRSCSASSWSAPCRISAAPCGLIMDRPIGG